MISDSVDPADVGPLYHHGPELLPFVDLIVGGGLPIAAALWLGRLRSVRTRFAGGGHRAAAVGPADASRSTRGDPPVRSPVEVR